MLMISFQFYIKNKNEKLIYKKYPHFSENCPQTRFARFTAFFMSLLNIFKNLTKKHFRKKTKTKIVQSTKKGDTKRRTRNLSGKH